MPSAGARGSVLQNETLWDDQDPVQLSWWSIAAPCFKISRMAFHTTTNSMCLGTIEETWSGKMSHII